MSKLYDRLIKILRDRFPDSVMSIKMEYGYFSLSAKKDDFHKVLYKLRRMGFDHLSDVTAVDYIDEGEFEVIYHLWFHAKKLRGMVKVRVPRSKASIKSVVRLWPGAQIHERENHEMFGIVFDGNQDLSPLFLEDWDEIPPFRKDFDTREYVKRELEGV